jgi:triacylglycerol lipase
VATYIGHPELHGPKGVGLKGALFMSSPGFSILPATPRATEGTGPCMQPDGSPTPAAAPGPGRGAPNGDAKGKAAAPAKPDAATLLARSNLPGLQKSKLSFFVSAAELDPPSVIAFAETLRDQLCAAKHCPTYNLIKDHSHISEVMSPNTVDTSVTGPILQWMKSVK